MVKKYFLMLSIVLTVISVNSQSVGKYKFNNKEYYVYPYRISSNDIPLIGIKIPDGEYIVFDNYSFKKKFSLKRRNAKYKLADTTTVNAIITVKNNLAEGPATFYEHEHRKNRPPKKAPAEITTGILVNGLKDGEWRSVDVDDKSYDIYNYKNGIQTGYYYRYNSLGQLRIKEKYCEGKPCDTIFTYYNGKIAEEYDIGPRSFFQQQTNIYQRAVSDLGNNYKRDAKTYFKKYDHDGKLILSLRYIDGVVQPFDSIGVVERSFDSAHNIIKYVTIKNDKDGHRIITNFNKDYFGSYKSKTFFKNDFRYSEISRKIELRRKRKNFFNRKWRIYRQDTFDLNITYTDLKDVDENSSEPIISETRVLNGYSSFTYYIPKLDFDFKGSDNFQLVLIDTLNKSIYFNDAELGSTNEELKKITLVKFTEKKAHIQDDLKSYPFQLKDFIVISNIDIDRKENYYENYKYGISSEDFKSMNIGSTYFLNDSLLNGSVGFNYNLKKGKNWDKNKRLMKPVTHREDNRAGNFKNGKKDGLWTEIDWEEPKKFPNDLRAYFFSHPKSVKKLREKNYKNGLREGSYVSYKKVSQSDRDFDFYDESVTGENKKSIIKKNTLFKNLETEYKNDSLNGAYKEYYANGKIRTDAHFVMGKPDGDYIRYNKHSKISYLVQFNNGLLNGKYERYEDGNLKCYAFFKNNILADSLIFYSNTNKPLISIYTNNEKLRTKKLYFSNGRLKEEMDFNASSGYMLSKQTISSESFINNLTSHKDSIIYKVNGTFKNYYDNGQKLAEGSVIKGKLTNNWNFYSITGQLLHNVNFRDSSMLLKGNRDTVKVHGFYTGYYANGKKRCTGYLTSVALNYDCFTKQDKVDPEFIVIDFFDINGKQTVSNGSGYFIKYDPDGVRTAAGKLVNFKRDSLWRYYTPEQKLDGIGFYLDDEKEGVWYTGDLEGINFEDGACFDMSNPAEVKAYEQKRKDLNITRSIYKDGTKISYVNFRSNLSKTYKPRNRRHYGNSF